MNPAKVTVTELIAWGLDAYPYRDSATDDIHGEIAKHVKQAQQRLSERDCYESCTPLLLEQRESINHLLAECEQRPDLQVEYEGLDWTLGVVDLRRLLAFQRRLIFSSADPCSFNTETGRLVWVDLVCNGATKRYRTSSCE